MPWYQLNDAKDPKLDELAKQYNLHPLHIEDARSTDESVKVDTAPNYTFAVFKPVRLEPDPDNPGEQMPVFTPIDIFAGKDFLITISDPTCPTTQQALDRARRDGDDEHPGKLLYLILDTIVDLYFPAIDHFDDRIDQLEDQVFNNPSPEILQSIFAIKRELIDLRRASSTLATPRSTSSAIPTPSSTQTTSLMCAIPTTTSPVSSTLSKPSATFSTTLSTSTYPL
jgi:magnesium transporter